MIVVHEQLGGVCGLLVTLVLVASVTVQKGCAEAFNRRQGLSPGVAASGGFGAKDCHLWKVGKVLVNKLIGWCHDVGSLFLGIQPLSQGMSHS